MMSGESKIHIHLTACQNVGPQNSLTDPDVLRQGKQLGLQLATGTGVIQLPFSP
jgi:hypothetical protein